MLMKENYMIDKFFFNECGAALAFGLFLFKYEKKKNYRSSD